MAPSAQHRRTYEPRAFQSVQPQQQQQQQQLNNHQPYQKCRVLPQHFVTNQPLDDLAASIDDEEDDEDDEDDYGPSGFYDVDHFDDDDNDSIIQKSSEDQPEGMADFADFERDEDDMLTEREDRFYVDERGQRRVIEKCILVGVEDLSAKRRLMRRRRNDMRNSGSDNEIINNQRVEDEDMLFTLDESLTEMRELIKTAGMECVGGKNRLGWGVFGVLCCRLSNCCD